MINNYLQGNLPDADVQHILSLVTQINDVLPFLMSLTPNERIALRSISDARLPYVLKLVEYAGKHRVKIGMAQEDLDELQQNAQLFEDLTVIFAVVEDLYVGLRDTRMQVGANLFRQSRAGHAQIEIAYAKGRPGLESIMDNLDKLFANQGRSLSSNQPENNTIQPLPNGPEGGPASEVTA